MELRYDTLEIHNLGDVTINQTREFEGGEAVHRARVTLRITVDAYEDSFADNYGLITQLLEALKKQSAVLRWTDTDTVQDYVNQTVTLVSADMPDDPSSWGSWAQQLVFTVFYFEDNLVTSNITSTFQVTGSSAIVPMGEITTFDMDYDARRFSEQRSQRQHAAGRAEVSGLFKANPLLDVAARRTALMAQLAVLDTAVNSADGTLKYGTVFERVVRVDNLKAKINQAVNAIEWSLTASWSRFPSEEGYATAEFSVATRDNVEDGEETLSFSGRILAQNRAAGTAKLDSLRASVLTLYGYTAAQKIGCEKSAQNIYGNGDVTADAPVDTDWNVASGVSFIELTFGETYRKRASLISSTVTCSTRDDSTTGLVATTYSGSVSASGATPDAAYTVALTRAQTLGADKEAAIGGSAFLKSVQTSWTQRRTRDDNAAEFVRLDFSYEYQSKIAAGRAYFEVTSSLNKDSFGPDTEQVSGFVVANTFALAEAVYLTNIRNAYNTATLHGERRSQTRVGSQKVAAITTQQVRLEFSFEVHQPKATGTATLRYSIGVSLDYLALERTTRISGQCFAANRAAADTALLVLAVLAGGSLLRTDRNEEREWMEGAVHNPNLPDPRGNFLTLSFDDVYVDRLSGDEEVIEMKLTESVSYSGSRLIVQPTLKNSDGSGGFSVVQDLSVQEGSRSIRGSVTAATREIAETWAKQQRALLTGTYVQPEQWEVDYEFIPRVAGVATGVAENVKLWRVGFNYSEILPNNPAPV